MKPHFIISMMVLTTVAFFAPSVGASDIPELVLPGGVGVNIHFVRGHDQDLDLIAAAGFRFVRQDFFWGSIERIKGEYDWSEYDGLMRQLDKRGIHAYFILDYSNPLYEQSVTATNPVTHVIERHSTASPQHPESVVAFARWAAAAARHFHGRGVIWEIWNEPNIDFWKPKPDVNQYATLALSTCKAIREADPQATIVGPATSGFPWNFLEHVFESGLLQYVDAVSVHPYRPPSHPPETAAVEYQRLRGLIQKYAPEGKATMPILSGEWGYSSNTKGITEDQQANFIARQQLSNFMCGVPVSIWYDWKNDGNDPGENEHNFGTVTSNLRPKAAYLAIQTLTHELARCQLEKRLNTDNTNDFILVFSKNQKPMKIAAWTVGKPDTFSLSVKTATAKELTYVNGDGQRGTIGHVNGNALIPLNGTPKYIDLGDVEISK